MIGYWIQRHDYSSETVNESSLVETIRAYSKFDWESEISKFQKNVEGKDCPPGIGINNGKSLDQEGSFLLHICPFDTDDTFFNYHYQKPLSFLGLKLGSDSEIHHVAIYPRDKITKLIEIFYAGTHQKILEIK